MDAMRSMRMYILLWVTLLNYAAQIPYYIHNYYLPYHVPPTLSSVLLLSATLAWFLIGYVGLRTKQRFGFYALLSFLLVEALFYLHSFIFGAFSFQMQNPSILIKLIFFYGYVSGVVAGLYAFKLLRTSGIVDKEWNH